jgi:hypothetical protein
MIYMESIVIAREPQCIFIGTTSMPLVQHNGIEIRLEGINDIPWDSIRNRRNTMILGIT